VTAKGIYVELDFFHTRGETPRHFKFDSSGQFLVVANQDSNTVAVFTFNQITGDIVFTGNEYRVPSPNFICSCPIVTNDADNENVSAINDYYAEEECLSSSLDGVLQTELQIANQKILELEKRLAILTS